MSAATATSPTPVTTTTTTTTTAIPSSDLDERVLAFQALEAAEDNLQSLCASHAGTFVQVERRGKALEEGLHDLCQHLERVQALTTDALALLLQQEGDGDGEARPTLATLAEQHRVRRRTLLQHSSLLELLELPSLMDACVRSNLYDEALSIAGLANTLERRSLDTFSSSATTMDTKAKTTAATISTTTTTGGTTTNSSSSAYLVVRQVVEQIRQRQEDLRQQLWQRLSQASVTLPDCLEVVTALRRLNAIDLERSTTSSSSSSSTSLELRHASMEVQLQIDFLEARDVWLETTTRGAAAGNSSSTGSTTAAMFGAMSSSGSATTATAGVTEDLLDTIERYRTRVFEIATQFNAIFRAHASISSSNTTSSTTPTATLSSAALLRLWMSRRVESFLQILAIQLSATVTETSHLRDTLEAALFFATSLGRLGADFSARLPELFEPVLVQIITTTWNDGSKQLNETLVTCREAGVATPLANTVSETTTAIAPESMDGAGGEDDQPLRPPRMLLNYPPLARLVNAILLGLNELRRCLLPGVVGRLQKALQSLLENVRQDLVANERAVHVPGLAKGPQTTQLRQVSVQYKELLTTIIEPYLWGSLHAAVGNTPEAQAQYRILQTNLQPPVPEKEEKEETTEKEQDHLEPTPTTTDNDANESHDVKEESQENVETKEIEDLAVDEDATAEQESENVDAEEQQRAGDVEDEKSQD